MTGIDALEGSGLPEGDVVESKELETRIGPAEVGEYAQSLLLGVREMAVGSGCTYLAYLLELAVIEASDLASGRLPSRVSPVTVSARGQPELEEILRRILHARG